MNPIGAFRGRRTAGPRSEPDLEEVLSAVGRGDEAAFGLLYDRAAALVHGIVLRVVRDRAQAEEVTQEVLVEIWRLAPRYEPRLGTPQGWMATIAHRRAVDRVRSEQSHRTRQDAVGRRVEREHDSVSEAVIDTLDVGRLGRSLQLLTPDQRAAIELAYYGGHTYREVAVLLDTPEGTIKSRIRDGLIKLRDDLGVST